MPRNKDKGPQGVIYQDPVEKLRKFIMLRSILRVLFWYKKTFIKSTLKAYHGIHDKNVDKILYFIYKNRKTFWLPLVAGMLAGLSQPPLYAFYLLPVAFVVLIRLLDFTESIMGAARVSVLFNLGFGLTALYWPGYGTYIFGFNAWIAAMFSACIVILSSIIPTIAVVIFRMIGLRVPMFRRVFLFATIWVLGEYLRGFTIFNFPFAFIGYSVGFWAPMFQSASIWGVLGVSFILVIWSLSFYPILFSQDRIQFIGIFRRFITINLAFVFIILAGFIRVIGAKTEYLPYKVALIQGNSSYDMNYETSYGIYSKMTYRLQELTNGEMDMIIWPEGAGVPFDFESNPLNTLNFAAFMKPRQTFIFNAVRKTGREHYNTAYSYTMPGMEIKQNADGSQTLIPNITDGNKLLHHDKKYLVPYGEYIPIIGKLKIGKAIARGAGIGFSAGKSIDILETPHGKILPLICYEITYSGKIGIAKGLESDYIVNITNDMWFGKSSGPFQHFVAAKYRAVEEGLSVVRVSNNGFSAIIDPYGRANSKVTKLFDRDVIISYIPKKIEYDTFFDFVGNIITILFSLIYTIYYFAVYYYNSNKEKVSKSITQYVEKRDNKKKDPNYIKRY